jgi:hypothetical protein
MSNRLILILIITGALVFRIAWSFLADANKVQQNFSDDKLYNEIAADMKEKGLMKYQEDKGLAYLIICPGVPFILSVEKRIFGENLIFVFLVNSLLSVVILLIIYFLAKLISSEQVALLSMAWGGLYVLYIKYIATSGKELWISFFFVLSCWLILNILHRERFTVLLTFLVSMVFAVLVHIDERYLAYLPVFALSFLFLHGKNIRFLTALVHTSLFTILVILLLIPWIYRNYQVHNELMILTPRTSHITSAIFNTTSKYPDVIREIRTTRYEISKEKIDSVLAGFQVTDNAGREMTPQQYDAIRNHRKLPRRLTRFENALMSFRTLWKPIDITYNYTTGGYRFDGKWSLRHNLSVGLTYGVLLPLSVIGWIFLFRRNRKTAIFLLTILVWHTLIHVIFIPFTQNRYRIPVDFIIIILGCQGIWYSVSGFLEKILVYMQHERT